MRTSYLKRAEFLLLDNDDLHSVEFRPSLMSQYISSFLVDPVVRQARRFSRPADESPHREPRPSLSGNDTTSPYVESALATTGTPEVFPPLGSSSNNLPARSSTGNQEAQSPLSLQGSDNRESQDWGNGNAAQSPNALELVETSNLEPEVNARRYTLEPAAIDGTSQNPLQGVYDGLRSTASSFSNSTQSTGDTTMSQVDWAAAANSTLDPHGRGDDGNEAGEGTLPADDGMSHMRKRIIAIQRADSSNEMKAKLVHGLMIEKHNLSQQSLLAPRAQSPGSTQSSERPLIPSSPKSLNSSSHVTSSPTISSLNAESTNLFHLSPEDLKPTYYQHPNPATKDGEQEESPNETEEDPKTLGCQHYQRNIKLQCSTCQRWYTCRFCHDVVEDHKLIRRETKNMLCMLCGCAQPASEECVLCSERGARYYCDICKFWDDSPGKSIYHCNDCGICRVGEGLGKDFFHCKVSRPRGPNSKTF